MPKLSNSLSGCEWEWETFTTVNDVTPSAEGSFYRGNLITALLALAKEHIRNQMFSGKSYIFSNTHKHKASFRAHDTDWQVRAVLDLIGMWTWLWYRTTFKVKHTRPSCGLNMLVCQFWFLNMLTMVTMAYYNDYNNGWQFSKIHT